MEDFYIYVYLNPLLPGIYKYGDLTFDHEPFYVGKGRGGRYKNHLSKSKKEVDTNRIKLSILNKIASNNLSPIIIKVYENLSENTAYEMENNTIKLIGKRIDENGPLSNIIDGGYGLTSEFAKKTWLDGSIKEKRKKSSDKFWESANEERKNRSLRQTGENNSFYGKTHTNEVRKAKSEMFSGEGNPMYGLKGELCPHWGKKQSHETSSKKSKSMKEFYKNADPDKIKEIGNKISMTNKGNPKMCGENNGNSKLNIKIVLEIRNKFKLLMLTMNKNKSIKELSKEYKISISSMYSIINEKTWKGI